MTNTYVKHAWEVPPENDGVQVEVVSFTRTA